MAFTMPSRTLEYALMGVAAGIIAGIVLVYVVGVTYFELLNVGESIRSSFKMP